MHFKFTIRECEQKIISNKTTISLNMHRKRKGILKHNWLNKKIQVIQYIFNGS